LASDRLQFAFQAHLAEYSALRQELLELVKWRDRLVFLSLGVSGALFSFALTAEDPPSFSIFSRRMALYLIAPLAAEVGGLYIVIQRRIYRIGTYFREVLVPKVDVLLANPEMPSDGAVFQAFRWEFPSHREPLTRKRRLIEWFVLISAFSLSGVMGQFLILFFQPNVFVRPGRSMVSNLWWANWAFVLASILLFFKNLLDGREPKPSSTIHRP
jgi:hypothetical protein